MHDFQRNISTKDKVFMLIGSILGAAITLVIISTLPLAQANLVSAILLASLIVSCANFSTPVFWWMGVGAIAGVIIGLGGIMAGQLDSTKTAIDLKERLTFVVFLTLSGFVSGLLLGRKVHSPHLPTLQEFLSSITGLTVGIYAVVVTIRFIVAGLEPARTLASRLSASTTILITLLALPGIVGYFLTDHRRKPLTPGESDINPSSGRHH